LAVPPVVCWSTGDCAATGERSAKPIRHTAHNLILLQKPRMYNPGFVSHLLSLLPIAEAIVTPRRPQCPHFYWMWPICHRLHSGNSDKIYPDLGVGGI
jgi:hypothetical protein